MGGGGEWSGLARNQWEPTHQPKIEKKEKEKFSYVDLGIGEGLIKSSSRYVCTGNGFISGGLEL